ncbi:MAG: hypothetical protein KJ737_09015 [Proteobacteria bacterium]|nr:hypothetical protein [Pseudomonadota bacterium]
MICQFRLLSVAVLLFGLVVVGVIGCSSGGGTGGDQGNTTGTTDDGTTDDGNTGNNDNVIYKDFFPPFKAGDYWEFYWTVDDTTYIKGSGTSNEITTGNFKIVLGPAETIGTITAYPLTISGTETEGKIKFAPRWMYLAISANQLLGSEDGSTFQTVFDGNTGTWKGGGFFTEIPDDTALTASNGTIDNEYTHTSAVSVGRTTGGGGCEYYHEIGQNVCDDDEYSYSEKEYYKSGIGPLGYVVRYTYSKTDLTLSFTIIKDVGLVATSFEADDGFVPVLPPWLTLSDMPTARNLAAASVYNDIIYVSGGRSGSATLKTLESYNPSTDTWATLAPMPGEKYMHTSETLGDRIYVFGGYGDENNAVYAYKISEDSWMDAGTISIESAYVKSVVIGDTIHVVVETDNYYAVTASSSGNSLIWVKGPDLPGEHHGFGVAEVGTTIFVIGNTYGSHYGTTRRYDTLSGIWSTVSSMPTGRRDVATGTVDSRLYVIGGYIMGDDARVVECFDPSTGNWTEKSSMPTAREEMAYSVVDDKIYVIGGLTDNVSLKTMEVYDPTVD